MASGFLYIKTHSDDPGTVRVLVSPREPAIGGRQNEDIVRYIARFNDVDGGRMHVQNLLCRALTDTDTRTYRVSVAEAIAAVESDNLAHRRVWIDPALSESELTEISEIIARRLANARGADRAWYAVGLAFIVLLFLQVIGLI